MARYRKESADTSAVTRAWTASGRETARDFIRREWPALYHALTDLTNRHAYKG